MNLKIFWKEVIMFSATIALGIFVALQNLKIQPIIEVVQPSAITIFDILWFIGAIVLIWFIGQHAALRKYVFWPLLVLVIFSGTQAVMASIVSYPWDLVVAIFFVAIFIAVKNILVYNIAIIAAIAGIGAVIGISISPMLAVLALILLSFYDIIAVYKTRHMVQMAGSMIQSGAIFGFIIPTDTKLFLSSREDAKTGIGKNFMILGSGDIALPVVFVSSLVGVSLGSALFVFIFAVLGLFVTHILFMSQEKRQAMAALPPIATMCILGYAIATLINL